MTSIQLFSASVLKGVLKSGKNDNMGVDENRRHTYGNHSLSCGNLSSVFGNLDGDLKQLITVCGVTLHSLLLFNFNLMFLLVNVMFMMNINKQVGLHAEHGYVRSLALFVADLGPVVWKIAYKKIESSSRELGRVLIQEIEMLKQQQRMLPADGGGSADTQTAAESFI